MYSYIEFVLHIQQQWSMAHMHKFSTVQWSNCNISSWKFCKYTINLWIEAKIKTITWALNNHMYCVHLYIYYIKIYSWRMLNKRSRTQNVFRNSQYKNYYYLLLLLLPYSRYAMYEALKLHLNTTRELNLWPSIRSNEISIISIITKTQINNNNNNNQSKIQYARVCVCVYVIQRAHFSLSSLPLCVVASSKHCAHRGWAINL